MTEHFFSKLWSYTTNPRKVKYALCLMRSGYLYERGWFDSFIKKKVITKNMLPYPWLTYPAIDFIQSYLSKDSNIFEYGSGNSTLFYCDHYNFVAAVEHDLAWHQQIKKQLENYNNYIFYFSDERNDFVNTIEKTNKLFDCIIIDGKWRNQCLVKATTFINSGGIIVLDDAERAEYKPSIDYIKNLGFLAIPFIGMSALSFEDHNTMIFIKK